MGIKESISHGAKVAMLGLSLMGTPSEATPTPAEVAQIPDREALTQTVDQADLDRGNAYEEGSVDGESRLVVIAPGGTTSSRVEGRGRLDLGITDKNIARVEEIGGKIKVTLDNGKYFTGTRHFFLKVLNRPTYQKIAGELSRGDFQGAAEELGKKIGEPLVDKLTERAKDEIRRRTGRGFVEVGGEQVRDDVEAENQPVNMSEIKNMRLAGGNKIRLEDMAGHVQIMDANESVEAWLQQGGQGQFPELMRSLFRQERPDLYNNGGYTNVPISPNFLRTIAGLLVSNGENPHLRNPEQMGGKDYLDVRQTNPPELWQRYGRKKLPSETTNPKFTFLRDANGRDYVFVDGGSESTRSMVPMAEGDLVFSHLRSYQDARVLKDHEASFSHFSVDAPGVGFLGVNQETNNGAENWNMTVGALGGDVRYSNNLDADGRRTTSIGADGAGVSAEVNRLNDPGLGVRETQTRVYGKGAELNLTNRRTPAGRESTQTLNVKGLPLINERQTENFAAGGQGRAERSGRQETVSEKPVYFNEKTGQAYTGERPPSGEFAPIADVIARHQAEINDMLMADISPENAQKFFNQFTQLRRGKQNSVDKLRQVLALERALREHIDAGNQARLDAAETRYQKWVAERGGTPTDGDMQSRYDRLVSNTKGVRTREQIQQDYDELVAQMRHGMSAHR